MKWWKKQRDAENLVSFSRLVFEKVYELVSWSFLFYMMGRLGLGVNGLDWMD